MDFSPRTMRRIISTDYTRYGGDCDHILYLDISIHNNSYYLCRDTLSSGQLDTIHLTSDTTYMLWLYQNADVLMSLSKTQWYSDPKRFSSKDAHGYYDEFYQLLSILDG